METQTLKSPTRAEYLDKKCTHREYYGSIVKDARIFFDKQDRIVQQAMLCEDQKHFNTVGHENGIPLHVWDRLGSDLSLRGRMSRACRERGDYLTAAGIVCILKEAVRQAIER